MMGADADFDGIRDVVAPVAVRHGVGKLYLFGSRARGDFNEDSDYDFCIEKGKVRTLFQMGALMADLEEQFGDDRVDLVTTSMDDKEFMDSIRREMVELYAE